MLLVWSTLFISHYREQWKRLSHINRSKINCFQTLNHSHHHVQHNVNIFEKHLLPPTRIFC